MEVIDKRSESIMKILIIGDSYVMPWNPSTKIARDTLTDEQWEFFDKDHQNFSWCDHLSEINPLWEVKVLGQGGCDNWWIYNTFLENYKHYDKIIICWTSESRYSWKSYDDINKRDEPKWMHVSNLISAQHKYTHPENEQQKDDYKVMLDFLPRVYYADHERYQTFSRLLKDNIQRINPGTMFINCFGSQNHIQRFSPEEDTNSLHSITQHENQLLGLDQWHGGFWADTSGNSELDKPHDCRCCHLLRSSHLILAKQIATAIDSNIKEFEIKIESFEREITEEDRREIWTKRDIIKYANKYQDAKVRERQLTKYKYENTRYHNGK